MARWSELMNKLRFHRNKIRQPAMHGLIAVPRDAGTSNSSPAKLQFSARRKIREWPERCVPIPEHKGHLIHNNTQLGKWRRLTASGWRPPLARITGGRRSSTQRTRATTRIYARRQGLEKYRRPNFKLKRYRGLDVCPHLRRMIRPERLRNEILCQLPTAGHN